MKLFCTLVLSMSLVLVCGLCYADICSVTSADTITCDNSSSNYTNWRVGKNPVNNRVLACAYYGGSWHRVGTELQTAALTNLTVIGTYLSESILIADQTEVCDTANSINITYLPSTWFNGRITIYGDRGDDTITGSYKDEYIYGEDGYDLIGGRSGDDYIDGGDDDDDIWGGPGIDTIHGGDGDDYIDGDSDVDYIHGEGGYDELHGDTGDDYIWGGDDTDEIYGEAGEDHLYGGNDRDYIHGGDDDDHLYGDDDAGAYDIMYGEDGDDYLHDTGNSDCDGGDNNTPVPPYGDICECGINDNCEVII